jgi:hypothetical protein
MNFGNLRPVDSPHDMMLANLSAESMRSARQAADQFSGIERAAGNFLHHSQHAGIVPADRRLRQAAAAANFPGT